jgi:hypothetical protein
MRQTAEHRLARLVQLGIRQARYFGRQKTLFQLLMAATVANLTLIATKTGQMRTKIDQFFFVFYLAGGLAREDPVGWWREWASGSFFPAAVGRRRFKIAGFRLSF